jgi:hypothetical protein
MLIVNKILTQHCMTACISTPKVLRQTGKVHQVVY